MKNGNKVAGFQRSVTLGATFAPLSLIFALGLASPAEAQTASGAATTAAPTTSGQQLDAIAAVVNGDVIMTDALDQRIQQVRQQLQGHAGNLPPENIIRQQVLDRMILEEIQLQMAQRAGITVSDDQLNTAISQIAQRDHMTLAQFRQAVQQQGLSYDDVRAQIRREILISQVQQSSIGSQVQVTDAEVNQYLENANAQAGVQYHLAHILVPLPSDPTEEQVTAARQEIQHIRDEVVHSGDFLAVATQHSNDPNGVQGSDLGWRGQNDVPTLFSNQVVNMNVNDVSQPIRSASGYHLIKMLGRRGGPQTSSIEQYHARHILISTNPIRDSQQAYALAEQIRDQLLHGASFTALASEYSNDYGSALQGGDLGWLADGETVPAFNHYLQTGPINQISQPIKTQFGWHLIEVEGRRQEDVTVQNERQQARQILFERKAQNELQTWLQQIRAQAYVENHLYPNDNGIDAINQSMAPSGQQDQ